MDKSTDSNPTITTIFIGADHGGYKLKEKLKQWLEQFSQELVDCGAFTHDPKDDYPLFAAEVANKVASGAGSAGILLCRSGGGMTIAANKIKGVRAVEIFDRATAAHAREHNHANVVALGGDYLDLSEAKEVLDSFFKARPSQDERHLRRIEQIKQLEEGG